MQTKVGNIVDDINLQISQMNVMEEHQRLRERSSQTSNSTDANACTYTHVFMAHQCERKHVHRAMQTCVHACIHKYIHKCIRIVRQTIEHISGQTDKPTDRQVIRQVVRQIIAWLDSYSLRRMCITFSNEFTKGAFISCQM